MPSYIICNYVQDHESVDEIIAGKTVITPYLIRFGNGDSVPLQLFIVAEKQIA